MGREVRRVPPDWDHPKDERGRYQPMFDRSFAEAVREWEEEELPQWIEGERLWREEGKVKRYSGGVMTIEEAIAETPEYRRPTVPTYEWWAGSRPERPDPAYYMPDWSDDQRTHFMMYEDTSEGTPISPAFETPEQLAAWLVETKADAGAGGLASYEGWLRIAKGGFCPTGVLTVGAGRTVWQSGVEATKHMI